MAQDTHESAQTTDSTQDQADTQSKLQPLTLTLQELSSSEEYRMPFNVSDERSARDICKAMLEKPDLPLFISMKCHLLLAGIYNETGNIKFHLDRAMKGCLELLKTVVDEDRDIVLHYKGIVDQALLDIKPDWIQFCIDNEIYYSSSDEEAEMEGS